MKYLKLHIYAAMALISVVIVRCIQLIFLTDFETGFFMQGMESIGTALSVFIALIIALSSALSLTSKQEKMFIIPNRSIVLGCVALLAGIANICEPIFFSGGLSDATPPWLLALRFIMIISAGGVLCWFGFAHLFNLEPNYNLSVILVIAWVIRLMSTFISFTGMSNISENLYDVLMLIMMLLFFLFQGKALCGIRKKNQGRKLLAIGIPAVLCTAASALPGLIISILGKENLIHHPIDHPIVASLTALYVAVYLVNICIDSAENL